MTYSNIQGGWLGTENINENPLFLDVENGDYSLQASSPAIDAGTSSFVVNLNQYTTEAECAENGGVWADPNCSKTITIDQSDYFGDAPDMGAHEFQSGEGETSLTTCGDEWGEGDINQDQTINVVDVVLLVDIVIGNHTPDETESCLSDLTQDSQINIIDIPPG